MGALDFIHKDGIASLYDFIDKSDKNRPAYHFSLKNGSIFFAICGMIWWCSELLLDRKIYCLTMLVGEGRHKLLYKLILMLYLSSLLILFVTLK